MNRQTEIKKTNEEIITWTEKVAADQAVLYALYKKLGMLEMADGTVAMGKAPFVDGINPINPTI